MPQQEQTYHRDKDYSMWHRIPSVSRYVTLHEARQLTMMDLDIILWVEAQHGTNRPVALLETARDVGQATKTCTITAHLAKMASIPAFCVLYRLGEEPAPADPKVICKDITAFRVRQIAPQETWAWTSYSPAEYAYFLLALRTRATAFVPKAGDTP